MNWETIFFIFAGGFIPAFVWLFFWLKEDENPEPNRLLVTAFLSGMFSIPIAFALSWGWCRGFGSLIGIEPRHLCDDRVFPLFQTPLDPIWSLLLLWGYALAEEFSKYYLVHALIFWRRDYNEPADAMIYLITAALGFAAVENALYLIEPFRQGFSPGFQISNLRFIGATPLHALTSGVLGYFIAGSFFKTRLRKEIALFFGLFFATLLHTTFNLLILLSTGSKAETALIFLSIIGIFLLFGFERIKHKLFYTHA